MNFLTSSLEYSKIVDEGPLLLYIRVLVFLRRDGCFPNQAICGLFRPILAPWCNRDGVQVDGRKPIIQL